MGLSGFIIANLEPILRDWVAFARTQQPDGSDLDERALLDHGALILKEIARNMDQLQGDHARRVKSEGNATLRAGAPRPPSEEHARQRRRQGFEVEELVSEYRALRATVLRRWVGSKPTPKADDVEQVTRFNEAVDQAIAESLHVYVSEVDHARDLFLATVGHDLRGPLSTIANCAALDLRRRPEDASQAKIVLRSVAQMKALLDDLFEYTRHRLGAGLRIKPTTLQLGEFARGTLDEIDAIISDHALDLEIRGDMRGEWDAHRLHQALSNLVFNALKYRAPGTPVRVCVDGSDANEVLLTVENQGKSIPAAMLPQLFDPLMRQKNDDGDELAPKFGANLGLGLYVVREIAAAHGGTIDVFSEDSRTRFALRLPRHATA